MTPAEAKNLRALRRRYVEVKWRDPNDDWPFYRLLAVNQKDGTVKLRGMDYPRSLGGWKHAGDEFWADWQDIKSLNETLVGV